MNKKGQVLALFVLLLPILILLVGLIIDTGIAYIEIRKIENILYSTIDYGLEHIEENDIESQVKYLIDENLGDEINTSIVVSNQKITIQIEKNLNTFFNKLNPYNNIKQSYQGDIINGEKNIKRMG